MKNTRRTRMRRNINKLMAYVSVVALSIGTINLVPISNVIANDIDGDIVENPWQSIFMGDHDNSDLEIDNTDNKDINKNQNNDFGALEEKEATASDTATVKALKKQLKTKVVSATKKSKKAKTAKIVIKKVKKAVSYRVKYSTNKKFKKSKTKTKICKKTKITLNKLKAGKKYYVKVRAVGKLNGRKVYGSWSKRKAIKVKKK